MKLYTASGIALVCALCYAGLTGCYTTRAVQTPASYSNPSWGPTYYAGNRYYYIPDIQTYYDLSNQDFAYMDDGQWHFSNSLPYMYSGYNLNNCYVIVLDNNVYQPWTHHQYYESNYPRYYYRNKYQPGERINMRGFNENNRKPMYGKSEDNDNRDKANDPRKNERPDNIRPSSRPPQPTNNTGRNLGEPVKVTPQMREPRMENNQRPSQNTRSGTSSPAPSSQKKRGGGRS